MSTATPPGFKIIATCSVTFGERNFAASAFETSPGNFSYDAGAMNGESEVVIDGDAAKPEVVVVPNTQGTERTATWRIVKGGWDLTAVAHKRNGVKWGTLKISGHDGAGQPFEYDGNAIVRIPKVA